MFAATEWIGASKRSWVSCLSQGFFAVGQCAAAGLVYVTRDWRKAQYVLAGGQASIILYIWYVFQQPFYINPLLTNKMSLSPCVSYYSVARLRESLTILQLSGCLNMLMYLQWQGSSVKDDWKCTLTCHRGNKIKPSVVPQLNQSPLDNYFMVLKIIFIIEIQS